MTVTLFIGNLHYETTENDLIDHLKQFGEILSCEIRLDRFTFRSKGFGSAEAATEEDARSIMENGCGSLLHGRPLKIELFR